MTSTDCCAKSVAGCELTWDYMPTGRTELRQRSTAGNTDSETAGWSRRPPGRPSPRTPGALPRNTRFIQHRDRPRQQPRAREIGRASCRERGEMEEEGVREKKRRKRRESKRYKRQK